VIAAVRKGANLRENRIDSSIPSWERLHCSGPAGVYQRNH